MAITKYLWEFGDGNTSTEFNPVHTYVMPGIYTVSLTVWDSGGVPHKITNYNLIIVYDFDPSSTVEFHATATNACFRSAVIPEQGVGIVKITGAKWLWPTAYTGTCRGMDSYGNSVSLVCDNRTGKFYRIGISELWTDKTDDYGGYEIESKIQLKERTALAGEYEEIEHVESHLHIRPWKEENRDQTGFDANGFRDEFSVNLQVYENGEPTTPSAKLEDVSRYGDYVFRKRVEARRLQLEYILKAAAWRIVREQELYMPINKAAGPAFDYSKEQQWQYEFRGMDLWLSRDRLRPKMNRAKGVNFTGSYDVLEAGPDGQSNSAMAFAGGSLTGTLPFITGDFTLSFWINNLVLFPGTIFSFTTDGVLPLTIMILKTGTCSIDFSDGTNIITVPVSWLGSGWVLFTVVKDGLNLKIYENGSLITTVALTDSAIGYGGSTIVVPDGSIVSIFDIRRIPRALSALAISYYYNEIINNGKQTGFLPILR